jgi:hypothetical protein
MMEPVYIAIQVCGVWEVGKRAPIGTNCIFEPVSSFALANAERNAKELAEKLNREQQP